MCRVGGNRSGWEKAWLVFKIFVVLFWSLILLDGLRLQGRKDTLGLLCVGVLGVVGPREPVVEGGF